MRALKLQCGHSSVLHPTNDAWCLNHDSNDRSLGQESLEQVTASPRWTKTVPKHSGNGKVRIVPPGAEPEQPVIHYDDQPALVTLTYL
jgi:hypothetical protein